MNAVTGGPKDGSSSVWSELVLSDQAHRRDTL